MVRLRVVKRICCSAHMQRVQGDECSVFILMPIILPVLKSSSHFHTAVAESLGYSREI